MAEQQLPEGWVLTSFTDLLDTKSGNSKLIKGKLSDTSQHNLYPGFSASGQDVWLTTFEHDHEAVIVSAVGARCGKTFLAKGKWSAIANTHIIKPFSACINIRFLHYLTNREEFWVKGGSAQPFVKVAATFERQDFLPPLAEQQVIADTLDRLLAQVERSKARLQRIPQLLKRFRQSVLAAAVSGKLTEEWRSNNPSYVTVWRQTTFSSICTEITVGYVGKMIDRYKDSGIAFLRSQNVKPFKFSSQNLLYISEAFHNEIYKSRLEPGDLAIVRSGAPGTTCVIPKGIGPANCSDLVIARPSKDLISEFGCIFMNSEVAQKNVADNQVGVAQQHFNVGSMKKMPISLPSLEEQAEIVRRVEQLFAYADRIEQQAQAALARVNRLTQAILAKAFRGELTEQWRRDNPHLISGDHSATALLARIQAERAKAPTKGRGRKSNSEATRA